MTTINHPMFVKQPKEYRLLWNTVTNHEKSEIECLSPPNNIKLFFIQNSGRVGVIYFSLALIWYMNNLSNPATPGLIFDLNLSNTL